jgi:hypothetical protein
MNPMSQHQPQSPQGRQKPSPPPVALVAPRSNRIELSLQTLDQLFNTMDPSPFHQKDLDHDAEEFIVSWAQEFHREEPIELVIHLSASGVAEEEARIAQNAIHNYFAYRARLNDLEFKRLMKVGRASLLVGLSFLGLCFLTIELVLARRTSPIPGFFKEGLTIAGWVAMWKPLEIYLYDWWPLRRKGQIYTKLSRMPVQLRSAISPPPEV